MAFTCKINDGHNSHLCTCVLDGTMCSLRLTRDAVENETLSQTTKSLHFSLYKGSIEKSLVQSVVTVQVL